MEQLPTIYLLLCTLLVSVPVPYIPSNRKHDIKDDSEVCFTSIFVIHVYTLNHTAFYKIANYPNFFCYLLNQEVLVFFLKTDLFFS